MMAKRSHSMELAVATSPDCIALRAPLGMRETFGLSCAHNTSRTCVVFREERRAQRSGESRGGQVGAGCKVGWGCLSHLDVGGLLTSCLLSTHLNVGCDDVTGNGTCSNGYAQLATTLCHAYGAYIVVGSCGLKVHVHVSMCMGTPVGGRCTVSM